MPYILHVDTDIFEEVPEEEFNALPGLTERMRMSPKKKPISDDDKVLQKVFLAHYSVSGNVRAAAQCAGIARQRHEYWKQNDPDYLASFYEAQQEAGDLLVAEARRRALVGVPKARFYKGMPVWERDHEGNVLFDESGKPIQVVEYEYSDNLLMMLLRAHDPALYAGTGVSGDAPVVKTYVELTVDALGTRSSALPGDGSGEGALGEQRS